MNIENNKPEEQIVSSVGVGMNLISELINQLKTLDDERRKEFLDFLSEYMCMHCGSWTNGRSCHCWNDD